MSKDLSQGEGAFIPAQVRMKIKDLKPHPRNYRSHPEDQIEHLMRSIKDGGFYRNVVLARDNTILAGHGIVLAATRLGMADVPCVVIPVEPDSANALKILTGDNYVSHLAENDDRALTDILRELANEDDLDGTGFSKEAVAALAMVTRNSNEIASVDEAAEWAGAEMPEFQRVTPKPALVLYFDTETEREQFKEKIGFVMTKRFGRSDCGWWPPRQKDDQKSISIQQG